MRRSALFVLTASASLLLLQAPASAGGWWTTLDLHDQYLVVGESLELEVSEVFYDSVEEAREAHGTNYYAYLVKDFDRRLLEHAMGRPNPERWWRPLSPVIPAGQVTILEGDANLARARLHLTVPDVPPGRYALMLCDGGCHTPLGKHIPIDVTVTEDALLARTAARLEGTNQRLRLSLDRVRRDVRQTQPQLQLLQDQGDEAEGEVAAAATTPGTELHEGMPAWIAYAGWFIAGARVAVSLRRRPTERSSDPDLFLERVPDDARELTKTS
ncbi:MAG: hypothetical protein M3N53_06560 [Actinomycetota bacterium]|nr:hypothetical protein [Actinomycetota bacterium]